MSNQDAWDQPLRNYHHHIHRIKAISCYIDALLVNNASAEEQESALSYISSELDDTFYCIKTGLFYLSDDRLLQRAIQLMKEGKTVPADEA